MRGDVAVDLVLGPSGGWRIGARSENPGLWSCSYSRSSRVCRTDEWVIGLKCISNRVVGNK